jgi:arylsulfatase A-like enzyme
VSAIDQPMPTPDTAPRFDATGRPPDGTPGPGRLLVIVLWFALLTGLIEVTLLAIKRLYLGQIVRVGPDVVWMAPVADAAFFLVPGVVLALLAWRRQSSRMFWSAVWVSAFLSFLSVSLLFHQLELYAKALIAAGLAVQATRLIVPRGAGFYRLVRRTLPVLVGLIVVLTVAVHVSRAATFDRAVARLPQNAQRAPNILLIVLDTVRAQSLSAYGYQRPTTPALDRWAKTGVRFERAISTSPWTFPSHASMFTGRWPHELSADWHSPLDGKYPTLAEVLRDRGFVTAGFAANTFYCTSEFGLARGFLHYEDYPVSLSQTVMSSAIGRELISFSLNRDFSFRVREWIGYQDIPGRRTAAQINDAFLDWAGRQPAGRPFFAFLNYLDAHQPFLPPSPFDEQFRGAAPRGDPRHWWDRPWTPQEIKAETDAYDGAIAYLDHQLDRLFEELRRRGQLDDTVVVITSDHGEHLGEHGFMRHGNTLYMEVLHVPLLMVLPKGVAAGATVPEPVSLRDLAATVLDLAGVDCRDCLPGTSLARYWQPGRAADPPASPTFAEVSQGIRIPDRYPNAKGELHSVIADGLHYIRNSQGIEELYDLARDPAESHNLVGTAADEAARARLRSLVEAVGQGRAPAPGAPVRPPLR